MKGKIWSDERKKSHSESRKGSGNPMYGISMKHTPEWNRRIGDGNRGKIISIETRDKLSRASKGRPSPFKGIKCPAASERQRGEKNYMFGKKRTLIARMKTSLSSRGEKHWHWKGGITKLFMSIRATGDYVNWRNDIFKRDNYTCQWPGCGKRGGNLHAHHIVKSLSILINSYNIQSIEEVLFRYDFWDIVYGVTLCEVCHIKKTYDYAKSD